MFAVGFVKIAAIHTVPGIKDLTGVAQTQPFSSPIRRFAKGGRKALVSLTRIRDGIR